MIVNNFRLLDQIGAGDDGVCYHAIDMTDGDPVEVCLLTAFQPESQRWRYLSRRLNVVSQFKHRAAIQLRYYSTLDEPPIVVLDRPPHNDLGSALSCHTAFSQQEALTVCRELAELLAAAHYVGLAHGDLRLSRIRLAGLAEPKVDFFTGVHVGREHSNAVDQSAGKFYAPEWTDCISAGRPQDIFSLGKIVNRVLFEQGAAEEFGQCRAGSKPETVRQYSSRLHELIQRTGASVPEERPSADEIKCALQQIFRCVVTVQTERSSPGERASSGKDAGGSIHLQSTIAPHPDSRAKTADLPLKTLGRFRLLNKLGEGGMGEVYRAEDMTDGTIVAIKKLSSKIGENSSAQRRFLKEARLLAEVDNPYVTKLLEVNQADGVHYLVMEFVPGGSLADLLDRHGRLDESSALHLIADVARALCDAHQRGIVHRDIKPDNILLLERDVSTVEIDLLQNPDRDSAKSSDSANKQWRVKLTDFGLARHLVETESQKITHSGAILGTPAYMAPEQCLGETLIEPNTDVYAMGATLFHALTGRPPFLGTDTWNLIAQHCNDPPPTLKEAGADVGDAVENVVQKALKKNSAARYANAREFLYDIECILGGEPTSIAVHPKLPNCASGKVLEYRFVWDLQAAPSLLWPHVSNTERLNQAVGLPAIDFTSEFNAEGVIQRYGAARIAGVMMAWREHPFEWIEGRRLGVLREFHRGPFHWFHSVVELKPGVPSGTRLSHHVRVAPRNLFGRIAAALEIGNKARRSLTRVYRRIDAAVFGASNPFQDYFRKQTRLKASRRRRIEQILDQLAGKAVDPSVVEQLGEFVAQAPDQEVARIRPLEFARRFGLDPDAVVTACLHAAKAGLLILMWDLLCPICRITSDMRETLKALEDHGHCRACQLDYKLDFAGSIELVFRAHPAMRDVETGTYCIGGPAHSPHVVAQIRLTPGENIELDLALSQGTYQLRSPQLSSCLEFEVQPWGRIRRYDLQLGDDPPDTLPCFGNQGQFFVVRNIHSKELLVRIERSRPRSDMITAARAATLAVFRQLFPHEIPASGVHFNLKTVTLLATNLKGVEALYRELGDARTLLHIQAYFRNAGDRITAQRGAVVKTVGENLLAAFDDPADAVQAGLGLRECKPHSLAVQSRAAVHRGEVVVTTTNDHLDYFGQTVNALWQLLGMAEGGELLATAPVAADPEAANVLTREEQTSEIVPVELPGNYGLLVHRYRLRDLIR